MEHADRAPVPLFSHSSSNNTAPAAAASEPAAPSSKPAVWPHAVQPEVDYTPLPWTGYFDSQHDLTVPGTHNTFRLYTAGQHGQSLS